MLDSCIARLIEGLGSDEPVEGRSFVTWSDFRAAPAWFHERQRAAWESSADELVIAAGTGGGKTAMQAPWILREIQRSAPLIKRLGRGKALYVGPTLTLLEQQAFGYVEDGLQEEEDLGRLVRGSRPVFRFSADGLRRVLGFDDCPVDITFGYARDASNLESMVAIAGVWDEAGQKENKFTAYKAFNRRLKLARSTTFGQMRDYIEARGLSSALGWWLDTYFADEGPDATFGRRLWGTTPYEWNWFKSSAYDRAEAGDPGWELFSFPSWMNPGISREECEAERETMPEWEWEMMYLGKYTKPAGLVFDCFDALNVCEPFTIPASWKWWLGMDFGPINTAGVVWAEDPDSGEIVQVAEYWPKYAKTTEEHAFSLHQIAPLAITGAGGSKTETGWRDGYRSHGIDLKAPVVGDPIVQYGSLYSLVKSKKFRVFRDCRHTIGQFETFSRELGDGGEPTDAYRDEAKFHLLAASRYLAILLRPPAPKLPEFAFLG